MAGAEQEVQIGVSPADFFKVVTDYESYPDFLDEMESVKLLSRSGNTAGAGPAVRKVFMTKSSL